MGPADLRPLPIPLLVRYKLIDSCSLAGPVPAWYAAATIAVRACERFKNTKEKKREKRGGKETKKERVEVEVAETREALYRAALRNETEFMPRRSWHLLLRTCHATATHAKSTNELIH